VTIRRNFARNFAMSRHLLVALLLSYAASALALPFASRYALVVDEDSGKVLLSKNAHVTVPIASLTKLMTAMVVLDAEPDMDELIPIEASGIATRKRSWSRLPVGATLPRRTVLQLALMSSDNRAAASLAHAYPGGMDAFVAAVAEKVEELGMKNTTIEEPTGLSNANRSTAADLAKMAAAAAEYPEIVRITTASRDTADVGGRALEYRNTNRLVGQPGWDILLSKTGYTTPAGRCLIMRMQAAGQTVIVVLLNAKASAARIRDALNVRRFMAGEPILAQVKFDRNRRAKHGTRRTRFRPVQVARADPSN
jgi:D-alanyl-D-alanine endopeptidase (penicillin-binding protein 7)